MKENTIGGNSPITKMITVLITALMCLTVFSKTLWADTGPKRSLEIEIKNAPSEPYYVAILDDQEYMRDINDRPGCDHIPEGEEWVREMFFDYNEEGFQIFTYAGGYNSIEYSEEDIGDDCLVSYNYMVPSTFKVMLVTQSGKSSVSNEITAQAFYAKFEYDYETNTLIEKGGILSSVSKKLSPDKESGSNDPDYAGLAVESLIYLVITLTVEGLILLCFRLFTKKNLKNFLIINIATQLLLFAYNILCLRFEPMLRNHFQYWFAVEALIMLIEVLWYSKKLVTKQGKIATGRNIAYGITANLVSMFIDFPIMYFIVEVLH